MESNLLNFNNLTQVLERYGQALVEEYKKNLKDSDRYASGKLYNSINYKITNQNGTYTVSLNLEDYFRYVESGRKAGKFPPINKILDWIKIKPVLPYPMANGKLPTPNQLAYLIGRKIANEGFEGSNDLKNATDSIWNKFKEEIYNAIDKDFDDAIIKIFHY